MTPPRPLAMLILLAASGACSRGQAPDPGRGGTPVVMPKPSDPYAGAMRLVDAIAALPELSETTLEPVLGAKLTPVSQHAAFRQRYEALLPEGPFARVEVLPTAASAERPAPHEFERVIFEVRPGTELRQDAFRKGGRIGPNALVDVNPHIPPEGAVTYSARGPKQSLHFEFTAESERLRLVVVERH